MVSHTFHAKITLVCRDCRQKFIASVGEPKFFAGRGLTSVPTRCPACCNARKARLGRFPGGITGGRYSSAGTDWPQYEMYPVVCSECGSAAQVPFVPSRTHAYCCSDCFVNGSPRSASIGKAS